MAWRDAPGRSEATNLVEREVVAGEVERGVLEDRRVPGGEDEAIPIDPVRVLRVMAQVPGEQHPGDRCERHGRAGMAGSCTLDGVHGEGPDRVDTQPFHTRRSSGRVHPGILHHGRPCLLLEQSIHDPS